jgi:hypothetical protein
MKTDKQDSTPGLVFFPLVFISIIILSTWIYNKKQEVKPGQTWYYVLHQDNPYEKKDTLYAKILSVKEDYAQYVETKGKRVDTTSSPCVTISNSWTLKGTVK